MNIWRVRLDERSETHERLHSDRYFYYILIKILKRPKILVKLSNIKFLENQFSISCILYSNGRSRYGEVDRRLLLRLSMPRILASWSLQ
jgi:hypothetical protein